jgi:hypothetical protein
VALDIITVTLGVMIGLPLSMYTTKSPIDLYRFNVRYSTLKNLSIFCERQISIKLFYLYQRLQCRDNYWAYQIRLFRIMSIPTTFRLFRVLTSEMLGRRLPLFTLFQLKNILTFSVKDRHQLNYFICIKDFNAETITSLKLNLFSFFICGWMENDLPLCIYLSWGSIVKTAHIDWSFCCVHWHRKSSAVHSIEITWSGGRK